MNKTREWIRVTRLNPCLVGGCGRPDWCTYTADGKWACCMRVQSEKTLKNGGWLHRLNGEEKPRYVPHKTEPVASVDCFSAWSEWKRQTDDGKLLKLAERLGVEPHSLKLLGCVWCADKLAYGFPMFKARVLCGIRFRNIDGDKWSLKGGRQGIFVPKIEWHTTLYICEGPTDCAAVLSIGLAAIGRPSCLGCEDTVNEFIKLKKIRRVVIVSDNDEPGQRGAERLQKSLSVPSVCWTPPCKDIREFLIAGGDRDLVEASIKNLVWNVPEK